MSGPSLRWYVRRLRRMSPAELVWRTQDHLRRATWASRQVHPGQIVPFAPLEASERRFPAVLHPTAPTAVPDASRRAIVAAADEILAGRTDVFGTTRTDLRSPDWFFDPVTGRRSDPDEYAFQINHRAEEQTGNVKQVWELSRHHHLTLLAMAWLLTRDDAYAERVADQLRSWWSENPFLSGIHWTSGIEIGIRLISWTWVRRLLADWPKVDDLFEHNPLAVQQIHWHQRYLAAFRSRGSSANNHVIAEAAGQLAAACAFGWFAESGRWRADAAGLLERELEHNTFPDGVNRELASEYHGFVAELSLLAAVEADAAGAPLSNTTWDRLTGMLDAAAAMVDETGRAPRQGDGDEGRALALAPAEPGSWSSLLALGGALVEAPPWWPRVTPDARSVLVASLAAPRRHPEGRPTRRPSHLPDAGVTLLRTTDGAEPEIWCRCDAGPHGFLSIAAHAHADALSVEVRVGGVDVLADPGTYCYHGEPAWRAYFRSTLAHNTVELDGQSQSGDGGPFLWLRHASGRVLDVSVADEDDIVVWCAEHDGYQALDPSARHRRTVRLDRANRTLHVTDDIQTTGQYGVRMAYHLGPSVHVVLDGNVGHLEWPTPGGTGRATVQLPSQLRWSMHEGDTDPILGWYSPGFGQKVPAGTLLGHADTGPDGQLITEFRVAR